MHFSAFIQETTEADGAASVAAVAAVVGGRTAVAVAVAAVAAGRAAIAAVERGETARRPLPKLR